MHLEPPLKVHVDNRKYAQAILSMLKDRNIPQIEFRKEACKDSTKA